MQIIEGNNHHLTLPSQYLRKEFSRDILFSLTDGHVHRRLCSILGALHEKPEDRKETPLDESALPEWHVPMQIGIDDPRVIGIHGDSTVCEQTSLKELEKSMLVLMG
jgi:hypothetical protein